MADLLKTTWHDVPALALESAVLRVVIVPHMGAKIVSILDKTHQHEWLVPPMRAVKTTHYGADFVLQDMSGWDEMMPTIVACELDGTALPDHGEVWSIPWMVEESADAIVTTVAGVALPYQLTRSVSFVSDTCLKFAYTLMHTGENAFPYLWAAHPQFAADPHTRVQLPPEVQQVVNVMDDHPEWGASGEQYAWPQARSVKGQTWQLDQVRPVENKACRKFYILPNQHIGRAALIHEKLGCELRLEWNPVDLPYLGLWFDEGTYNSRPVAAIEPCNGYYDSLERAIRNETATVLEPGTEKCWELLVSVSSRTRPITS